MLMYTCLNLILSIIHFFLSMLGMDLILLYIYTIAAASVFIEEDVMVATQLLGTVSYFQYELPDEGLTLRLNVAAGRVVLYASTRIRNPNSAVYDIRLETDATEDVFVSPDDLIMTGVGTAIEGRRKRNIEKGERDSAVVMIFVTVEGLEKNNSFILESTFGDTSTSEFSIHQVFHAYASDPIHAYCH